MILSGPNIQLFENLLVAAGIDIPRERIERTFNAIAAAGIEPSLMGVGKRSSHALGGHPVLFAH
jgi:hypothetical protein